MTQICKPRSKYPTSGPTLRRGEHEAAEWYKPTLTGEQGNVTNATVSYGGHNTSAALEVHWRYMRRDTTYLRLRKVCSAFHFLL